MTPSRIRAGILTLLIAVIEQHEDHAQNVTNHTG